MISSVLPLLIPNEHWVRRHWLSYRKWIYRTRWYLSKTTKTNQSLHFRTVSNHGTANIILPQAWKVATVTPLHKKGSVKEPSNYRTISILPVLLKILDKHVINALDDFLTANDLSSRKAGFIINVPVRLHFIKLLMNGSTLQWCMNMPVSSLLIVAKPLTILLQKLNIHQSSENPLQWLSYPSDRNSLSRWCPASFSAWPSVLPNLHQWSTHVYYWW